MKNIKEVMVSLMAIAACALPSYGSAEGVTNQISNCVNAHGEEMAAAGRELSRNNEAPDVEGGVVEPEFENEGEDTDVALGESVNEADRLFYLALAYQYGDHGLNQDYANAMRLYREAAEAGSPTAMANIGCMYRYGKGVVSNNTRAVYWFKKAAEAGDPLGTHQLALSEAFGIGAERDLTAGLFIRKISDWWRWRRIKMEIHEEVDANPGEESEIDEGRHDVNLDEYDDPMPSSAEETSEDGK